MATLKERLRTDLTAARKDRDKLRTTLITTTLSEVRNREIEVGHELSDDETAEVVTRAIKRRREAAEQMDAGNRQDLADRERAEAEILTSYLPKQLSEDEVRALVQQAVAGGASNVGAVMGKIMPALKGKFDGKDANRIVREELG